MLNLSRRSILRGFLAAPIVCAPGVLMPVKVLAPELLKPVREVRVRAIRYIPVAAESVARVAAWPLIMPADQFSAVPEVRAVVAGIPIFDVNSYRISGDPREPDAEVIDFATPDKPSYWRGGIVGSIIHVGHPAIDGGQYRVTHLIDAETGDMVSQGPVAPYRSAA